MDRDDRVGIGLVHLHERAVAHDAGVVHQDVDGSERIDGSGDEPPGTVEVGDRVVVRDGGASELLDLGAYLRGRVVLGATTVERDADVVHHDVRTLTCEAERELASDAAARSGDDRDPAGEESHRRRYEATAVAEPVMARSPF